MTEAIYSMVFDCGRMGSLEGKFVTTKEKMSKLIESQKEVYFGEVLGKHSEVYGPIDETDVTLVSDDPKTVQMFKDNNFSSGYNPFEYTFLGAEGEWEDKTVEEYIDHLLQN